MATSGYPARARRIISRPGRFQNLHHVRGLYPLTTSREEVVPADQAASAASHSNWRGSAPLAAASRFRWPPPSGRRPPSCRHLHAPSRLIRQETERSARSFHGATREACPHGEDAVRVLPSDAVRVHPSARKLLIWDLAGPGRTVTSTPGLPRRQLHKDPPVIRTQKSPRACSACGLFLKRILAATYFPTSGPGSIIGDGGLNFRVRNGIGCTPSSKATRKFLVI